MSAAVIVTGVKELDAALANFEAKVQKKYIRQALRRSIKKVREDYRTRVPIGVDGEGNDTGVMRDAAVVRVPKGRKRNQIRIGLVIDTAKLMALYFARYGRFPGKRKADTKPFFYPAAIELGDENGNAQRPMRASLYGNEQHVKQVFIDELTTAVATAGKK